MMWELCNKARVSVLQSASVGEATRMSSTCRMRTETLHRHYQQLFLQTTGGAKPPLGDVKAADTKQEDAVSSLPADISNMESSGLKLNFWENGPKPGHLYSFPGGSSGAGTACGPVRHTLWVICPVNRSCLSVNLTWNCALGFGLRSASVLYHHGEIIANWC